ncbi:YdcF family protein [Montanilutibacter psychrotolerans]|uniref:YdcF family protein n=1 Tax=Montanilutibacter psychrotolerans TaxID=1327343 RepID=A0A3M8SRA3_9GAMM|nr:YdcF family protein [Lysobacter psychrotolerans]RNF83847.1 YdcF family protein [Lysobacter psychrotolerans]
MSSRTAHRLALFGDRDVLHAMAVASAACVLSAGLVYVGYFVHVLRVARRAPCLPTRGDCVLLFGKHSPGGLIDNDFAARLDRAVSLWRERPPASVVLLGGGPDDEPTEAELARDGLFARGMAADAPLWLEAESRNTLQNLRNARAMLLTGGPTAAAGASLVAALPPGTAVRIEGAGVTAPATATAARPHVILLSSRYHLARCALFARQLGFDAELCAAEPRLQLGPRMLLRLAGEAGYVCITDLGTRWARLIRHRRMLERVS